MGDCIECIGIILNVCISKSNRQIKFVEDGFISEDDLINTQRLCWEMYFFIDPSLSMDWYCDGIRSIFQKEECFYVPSSTKLHLLK